MGSGASSKSPIYNQPVDGQGNPVSQGTAKSSTSGGLSQAQYFTPTAANANPSSVKASAGTLYGYSFANTSTGWRYVHLYNKASAPVPGTDAAVRVVPIPPGGIVSYVGTDIGVAFPLGIGVAITTAPTALDGTVTGIAANDVTGTLDYA